MTEPIIGNVPVTGSLPPSEPPVSDQSAAPAVNASADQVGEPAVVQSVAAACGPLAMEAIGLNKVFKLGRGAVLQAVRDVSFGLYRGAVVALVGESGSGKSTVAKLLAGQERPTSGQVTLDGKPISVRSSRSFRQYKAQVQYVFQDPFSSLNPVHTVGYHLIRPVKLHSNPPGGRPPVPPGGQSDERPGYRTGPGAPSADERVMALLEQVRLTPAAQFVVKYPHELSGGQRQRVSFARALAAQPTVLLADEPVSMLDVSIRLEMLNLLDDLRTRLSLALLYITHDIASARYFADEVLVMYGGQIVERGPAEDVTQRPAHPYTQLLIASAPDPDNLGSSLKAGNVVIGPGGAIAGKAGNVGPAPVGCPFSNRCPIADDKCRRENPALQLLAPVHAAACWHLDEAAPPQASGSI
jgi:peptide/nickel transport system ATP-binding protein